MNETTILVCEECGSQDVQTLRWVNANTGKIWGEYSSEHYCDGCHKYVSVVSLEQYKLNLTLEVEDED